MSVTLKDTIQEALANLDEMIDAISRTHATKKEEGFVVWHDGESFQKTWVQGTEKGTSLPYFAGAENALFFHTHVNGNPAPSAGDVVNQLSIQPLLSCTGASFEDAGEQWGTIQCLTPRMETPPEDLETLNDIARKIVALLESSAPPEERKELENAMGRGVEKVFVKIPLMYEEADGPNTFLLPAPGKD